MLFCQSRLCLQLKKQPYQISLSKKSVAQVRSGCYHHGLTLFTQVDQIFNIILLGSALHTEEDPINLSLF